MLPPGMMPPGMMQGGPQQSQGQPQYGQLGPGGMPSGAMPAFPTNPLQGLQGIPSAQMQYLSRQVQGMGSMGMQQPFPGQQMPQGELALLQSRTCMWLCCDFIYLLGERRGKQGSKGGGRGAGDLGKGR